MSKIDAMRALREERAAERAAGTQGQSTPARRTPTAKADAPPPVAPPAEGQDALCGHRSMNGRTCTREQGHAAKNHRYS